MTAGRLPAGTKKMPRLPYVLLLVAGWSAAASPAADASPSVLPRHRNASAHPATATNGPMTMKDSDASKAQLLEAYREMYRAMLERRTDRLAPLLDDGYSLTHITGFRQPKREWLAAIDSGEMRYRAAEEKSVTVDVTGDTAVLVGRSVVTATIYGGRGRWNLQLTTNYSRKDGKWIALRTVATTF